MIRCETFKDHFKPYRGSRATARSKVVLKTTRSSSMSHLITLSILNAYFSRVYSLKAYLDTILIPQDDTQINDVLLLPNDPLSYSQFLSHSYVAFSGEVPPSSQPQFTMTQSFDSMRVVCLFSVISAYMVVTKNIGHHPSSRETVLLSKAEGCKCDHHGLS